jgi:hypothetical protein
MISDDDSKNSIEYDLTAKQLAQDFKKFIKSQNAEYAEKFKSFLGENFLKYNELLSNKIQDQVQLQDSKQNEVQSKIDKCNYKIKSMEKKVNQ